MARLVGYFARGCLAIVPVAATIYILYVIVTGLDNLLGVSIPGLGVALAIALITGVGFLVSNVVGKEIYHLFDRVMVRLPLVKLLYTSIRDLVEAMIGEKRQFGKPVAVRLSKTSELRALGFMSRDELPLISLPHHAAVYVPQAYNIGGQVLVVPTDQIEPLEIPTAELFTFMLSGGASGLAQASAESTAKGPQHEQET